LGTKNKNKKHHVQQAKEKSFIALIVSTSSILEWSLRLSQDWRTDIIKREMKIVTVAAPAFGV
jgi:hypothetical protein